jgi:predicted nucleic acid-binding Zn ribbon protein
METNKSCQLCGKSFWGRSDKKFCSNACRYEFNNQKKIIRNEPQSLINSILKRNRSILDKVCVGDSIIINRDELLHRQFNFEYFTNLQVDAQKQLYYFCYDFVYLPFFENNQQKVKIIRFNMRKLTWDPWKFAKHVQESIAEYLRLKK